MRAGQPITAPTPPPAQRPRAAAKISGHPAHRVTKCYKKLQLLARSLGTATPSLNPRRSSASSAPRRFASPRRTKAHHPYANFAERSQELFRHIRLNPPEPAQTRHRAESSTQIDRTKPLAILAVPTPAASPSPRRLQNKPTEPLSLLKIEASARSRAKQTHRRLRPSSIFHPLFSPLPRSPQQKYAERLAHKLRDTLRVPR